MCCSVLQCVAVCCSLYQESCVRLLQTFPGRGWCVGACCSVLQYVAVFIKRAVCNFRRHSLGDWRGRYVAACSVCCSALQRVAACCSVLQCTSGEVCVTFADILLEKQVYCNVAVCCCTLQTFPGRGWCVGACCSVLLYVAAYIKRAMCHFCRHSLREVVELQCVVVRCGMLQTFGRHVTHSYI